MIYKLGKIGVTEGMSLIAMSCLPNIYLSEPSVTIGFAGSCAWLLKLISGIIAALVMLKILQCYQSYCQRFHNGKCIDFYQFTKELLGSKKAWFLFFCWAVMFELQTIIMLREFADQVLITTLPSNRLAVIILVIAICMIAIIWRGLEIILRAAYISFCVTVIGIVVTFLLLMGLFNYDYLFPLLGNGMPSIVKHSFSEIGSWLMCFSVLFIAADLQDFSDIRRSIIYGIGYTVVLKIIIIIAAILVFGSLIAPERVVLFYEMVQGINLSQYLQRVDAVFIMMWMPAGLISTVLLQFFAMMLFTRIFELNDFKALIPLTVLLTAAFAMMPNSVVEAIELNKILVYFISSVFVIANFLIFVGGYYLKCRRDASCAGNAK